MTAAEAGLTANQRAIVRWIGRGSSLIGMCFGGYLINQWGWKPFLVSAGFAFFTDLGWTLRKDAKEPSA